MLGAPLRSLTLLHHAEAVARVPAKRRRAYRLPFATRAGDAWRTLRDIDVEYGPFPYDWVVEGGADPLNGIAAMAEAALSAGIGLSGAVCGATSHLFPARPLVRFATGWLEEHFGASPPTAPASAIRTTRAGTASPRRSPRA
jgi:aminoglycoside 3-N-acetyltransferase